MHKVYGMSLSGNCYKVRLLLEHLGEEYQWEEIDTLKGETRTPEFLRTNPAGKVPVLELSDGRHLPESNAILYFLAQDTAFWPTDPFEQAQVLQWLFFEQYSHEPYVAVARFICRFLPQDHPRRSELPQLHERGNQALKIMDDHLTHHTWFASSGYSIADIALYAYTHCAADGNFDLGPYPAINEWLQRLQSQPGFVAME